MVVPSGQPCRRFAGSNSNPTEFNLSKLAASHTHTAHLQDDSHILSLMVESQASELTALQTHVQVQASEIMALQMLATSQSDLVICHPGWRESIASSHTTKAMLRTRTMGPSTQGTQTGMTVLIQRSQMASTQPFTIIGRLTLISCTGYRAWRLAAAYGGPNLRQRLCKGGG